MRRLVRLICESALSFSRIVRFEIVPSVPSVSLPTLLWLREWFAVVKVTRPSGPVDDEETKLT
jgi:hypothetical protein